MEKGDRKKYLDKVRTEKFPVTMKTISSEFHRKLTKAQEILRNLSQNTLQ